MNKHNQSKPSFDLVAKVKKDAAASAVPPKVQEKAALRRIAQLLK